MKFGIFSLTFIVFLLSNTAFAGIIEYRFKAEIYSDWANQRASNVFGSLSFESDISLHDDMYSTHYNIINPGEIEIFGTVDGVVKRSFFYTVLAERSYSTPEYMRWLGALGNIDFVPKGSQFNTVDLLSNFDLQKWNSILIGVNGQEDIGGAAINSSLNGVYIITEIVKVSEPKSLLLFLVSILMFRYRNIALEHKVN